MVRGLITIGRWLPKVPSEVLEGLNLFSAVTFQMDKPWSREREVTGTLLHSKPILENFQDRSPQPPPNCSETEGVPGEQNISSGAILRTSDNVKSPRGPQG